MPPKTIIVTGASRGLGLAIAKYLINESHNVILAARSKDQMEALKSQHPKQVEYIATDLGNTDNAPSIIDLAVKTFGQVDGIVVNHGVVTPIAKMADASIEEWRKCYDINVFSGLALVKAALPELKKTNGCALWVSSGAARNAYTAWGAYGSGKAAVNHMSKHFAVENPDITSVAIEPGRVDTDMQQVIRDDGKDAMAEADHADFTKVHAEGKLLKPEQPGHVMARFVVNPDRSLSGKDLTWSKEELAAYHDKA